MFKLNIDSADFEKRVRNIENNADKMAEEIVKNLGTIAHKSARSNVPVDTGALKGSLTLQMTGEGIQTQAEIGTSLDYAASVEYGTSRQAAQPYLQPALREAERESIAVSKAVFKKYD